MLQIPWGLCARVCVCVCEKPAEGGEQRRSAHCRERAGQGGAGPHLDGRWQEEKQPEGQGGAGARLLTGLRGVPVAVGVDSRWQPGSRQVALHPFD